MSIPGTAGAIRSAETLGGRAAQADEQKAFETLRTMEEGPAGVKANVSEGMSLLEQINARMRRESGMANHEAFNTDAANNALMDYLSNKGSAQAAAETFNQVANEAIASGKLTAAEVSALEGYVGTAQVYVDAMVLLGDNGIAGIASGNAINGIPIVDGKVGGKIPLDEYKALRESSIKNYDADSMTLGQYEDGGANSYIGSADLHRYRQRISPLTFHQQQSKQTDALANQGKRRLHLLPKVHRQHNHVISVSRWYPSNVQ